MRRKVGQIRERLAELLLQEGISVDPGDLWTQEGFYRSRYHDLARWGSNVARWVSGKDPDGKPWSLPLCLCSWDTMTSCVRHGITFSSYERHGWGTGVEIHHAGHGTGLFRY